jgi:hypothetical protein
MIPSDIIGIYYQIQNHQMQSLLRNIEKFQRKWQFESMTNI